MNGSQSVPDLTRDKHTNYFALSTHAFFPQNSINNFYFSTTPIMSVTEESSDLDAEFQQVVQLVQNLPKEGPYQPTNGEKLKFYSYYKQGTEGPCSTPRPGFFDMVGKAKWDAWKGLGDMSKNQAKRLYIAAFVAMEQKMKELGHSS